MILIWRLLHRLATLVTRLLYLIIVIGAAAKVLVFSFSLYAESHKQVIEKWASAIVGVSVQFEKIETYWAGVTPRLWIRQLTLGDEEKLALGDTLVGVNLVALPHWRENLPIDIRLKGTRIQVRRDKNGNTRIPGMLKSSGARLPAHIVLEDAAIELRDELRGVELNQDHLQVTLFTRGNSSSLSIRSPELGFMVRGEIQGAINKSKWSGVFWARGHHLQTEKLLQAYLPSGYLLNNLQLDFEAWSYWKQGQHAATRIQLDMDSAKLHTPNGETLGISTLKGDLLYEKQGKSWTLQARNLDLGINGRTLEKIAMAMDMHQEKLRLGLSSIDLEPLKALLPLLSADNPGRQVLEHLSPTGLLTTVRADIDLTNPPSTPVFRGKFERLGFKPWKEFPGISNFRGDIQLSNDSAELELDTENAQLSFNTLFRQPLPVEKAKGRLSWKKTETDSWVLHSDQLLIDSPDLQTLSRLRIEKSADTPPVMDIQTNFANGNGSHAGLYYPTGIMKDTLVNWLDKAILSGKVKQGSFLFHGPLEKGHFPFHKTHDGHFEVVFDVEALDFSYHPQWPTLSNTSATIRFHNNDLQITAKSARLYNTAVRRTTARIDSLEPLSPLVVRGSASGPLQDYFRLIRETPLHTTIAPRIEGLSVGGHGKLALKLNLPLPVHTKNPPKYDLNIDFKPNAWMNMESQKIRLSRLQGQLNINNKGLHTDNLTARALGAEVSLSMRPLKNATEVKAQGRIKAGALIKKYPQLSILNPKGSAKIQLSLKIPGFNTDTSEALKLHIRSDLQGMALVLPEPLGKQAADSLPSSLDIRLGPKGTFTTLKYDNILGVTYKQATGQEAELLARISRLPVRDWLSHLNQQQKQTPSPLKLKHFRLETDRLDAAPLIASGFILDLKQVSGKWSGQVDGDTIAGSLEFSDIDKGQPLRLSLERLYLQTDENQNTDKTDKPMKALMPDEFPPLHLTSKMLRLNKAKLGSLEIITRKDGDNQSIDKLEIHGKLADISAHGIWEYSVNGSISWWKGVINTDNMGRLLKKALGMDFLSGSKTYLSFDLNWSGAPFQPNVRQMQGEAQLDMAHGRFLHFKPGLARILGLINFDALRRRLKLDFKDVYEEGMAFDTIMGNFQFDDGLMYTNNLEILGPSASILISGSIDLVNETYDQILSVSPRLDATLPVAGAIAGGPAAGLVVLLAQQAFSEKLQKIQRITYNVSGSWDDPQITRLSPESGEERSGSLLNE